MVNLYTDADYISAHQQKTRVFWTFLGVTAVYLAFCIAWVGYSASLPYGENRSLPKIMVYVASGVYAVFAYVYLSIKRARVRRYCKMLDVICTGLKTEEVNYFFEFRRQTVQKENVDVITCIFGSWDKRKQEWREREVYLDAEKPRPPFENGDVVHYVMQSNLIVQYEILRKKALQFEEVPATE